jgi:hypothetical protein
MRFCEMSRYSDVRSWSRSRARERKAERKWIESIKGRDD